MPLIDCFDHFLIDLDGVIYVGEEAVAGSVEAVLELRRRGKQVRFLTNSPTHGAEFYAERLGRLGLPTPHEDVLPVAGAVLAYLETQDRDYRGLSTLAIGSPELKAYLAAAGLEILEGKAGEQATLVVVGGWWDFDYEQLKLAGRAARQATHFLTCGRDAWFPMPDGPWPGAGAIVSGIEYMAGREAVSVGKPEPWLFRAAAERLPPGGRILVVGDNLRSDILGAQRAGYASAVVFTGHSDQRDLERSDVQPDYVLGRLAEVIQGNGRAPQPRAQG